MSADAFEDIAQVSEGIETQPFGGGDQAGPHGGGPATVVGYLTLTKITGIRQFFCRSLLTEGYLGQVTAIQRSVMPLLSQ